MSFPQTEERKRFLEGCERYPQACNVVPNGLCGPRKVRQTQTPIPDDLREVLNRIEGKCFCDEGYEKR